MKSRHERTRIESHEADAACDACAGCVPADSSPAGEATCAAPRGRTDRRAFLRDAGAALTSLVAFGTVPPARLAALPVRTATGRARDREVTYPLPRQDGVTIDRANEIILVRWESRIYAFALSCPHQRTMLKWRDKDALFQCPKHKSRYRPDGEFVSGRATRGMDRYPVHVSGTSVRVDTARAVHQDDDAAAWSAAAARLD